jgi:hypothetical protein
MENPSFAGTPSLFRFRIVAGASQPSRAQRPAVISVRWVFPQKRRVHHRPI